jgi:hypothetical protein
MEYEHLPTGKPHVSFSEVREWAECSFRHKLNQVDKVGTSLPSIHMDFGTAIHSSCENYLKTKQMDTSIFLKRLHELWTSNGAISGVKDYDVTNFKLFAKQGLDILPEVPGWLDSTFPGWEFIDAEHQLYEPIEGHPHAFKGFIDGVISTKVKGKQLIWLLDWKSCSFGWKRDKRDDPMVKAQLVLYKNFWASKTKTDPKDIRCGFVLLKRTGKMGAKCELVSVSVGDVTTKRSLTVVNNMITSVKKGIALKNRNSCMYCSHKNTPNCV